MLDYFLISIVSYLLGVFSVMFVRALKVGSKCKRKEEKEDFGQTVYNEIEKREKEGKI